MARMPAESSSHAAGQWDARQPRRARAGAFWCGFGTGGLFALGFGLVIAVGLSLIAQQVAMHSMPPGRGPRGPGFSDAANALASHNALLIAAGISGLVIAGIAPVVGAFLISCTSARVPSAPLWSAAVCGVVLISQVFLDGAIRLLPQALMRLGDTSSFSTWLLGVIGHNVPGMLQITVPIALVHALIGGWMGVRAARA